MAIVGLLRKTAGPIWAGSQDSEGVASENDLNRIGIPRVAVGKAGPPPLRILTQIGGLAQLKELPPKPRRVEGNGIWA